MERGTTLTQNLGCFTITCTRVPTGKFLVTAGVDSPLAGVISTFTACTSFPVSVY